MSGIAKALAGCWAKSSITADEWPGVLASGPNWRVGLNRRARGYIFQRPQTKARRAWGPLLVPIHRPEAVALLGGAFPGLPEALASLPHDPIDAAAQLARAQGLPVPPRRRKDWLAEDWPGVLAVDVNIRVVRDGLGELYAVQWRPIVAPHGRNRGAWITQARGASLTALADKLLPGLYEVGPNGKSRDGVPARLSALFEGLPEVAADGAWPPVKVFPAARAKRTR